LYLQVLDYDRFSRNDPIGEVSIPLNKMDLAHMQTLWKELKPCSDGSVSRSVLSYLPSIMKFVELLESFERSQRHQCRDNRCQ